MKLNNYDLIKLL